MQNRKKGYKKNIDIVMRYLFPTLDVLSTGNSPRFDPKKQRAENKKHKGEENYQKRIDQTLARIEQGADHLADSINHWKEKIENGYVKWIKLGEKIKIKRITLTGSDLHDEGLGTAFVTFSNGKDMQEVVIKPENREIEKSLFGKDNDKKQSLAEKLNENYRMSRNGQEIDGNIQTLHMETHADYQEGKRTKNYGTIIEKIAGEQIRKEPDEKDNTDITVNQGSTLKTMIMACLTGLHDLHYENMLWRNGEPVPIDADNALVSSMVGESSKVTNQTGFPEAQQRQEFQLVMDNHTWKQLNKDVRQAFVNKHGRVVPLSTSWLSTMRKSPWESNLAMNYILETEYPRIYEFLVNGTGNGPTDSPGLRKQTGGEGLDENNEYVNTEGNHFVNDLNKGQLPFYEYHYSTGEVRHNQDIIYKGDNIETVLIELKKNIKITK